MKRLLVTFIFTTAITLVAQNNNVPVIRVETRLVNVPVNVEDEHGVAVAGLATDSFTLLEDGKPQKIAVFERQSETPLSIVMAIDTSESVLTQFRTEMDAAKRFIHTMLREQDEMDLMAFSDAVDEVVSFTNNDKRVISGLSRLGKGDATAMYSAVYLAAQRLGESSKKDALRRRILVLITDGGDTTKGGTRYTDAVEQAQRAGAAIYPIIIMPIFSDAGRNVAGEHALIQMAEDTGGKFFYVTRKSDLDTAFAHLSDDLRTQYLLAYYAPQHKRDSGSHSIEVRLNDAAMQAKLKLRYRPAYFPDAR
ncbi:MAG: VWA domain-containing protein [Acidobacteria bacterium]|nr:VWA domain-containing protein [Acidobacteriota bacterium]